MSALLSLEEGGIFEKAPEDLRWSMASTSYRHLI